MSVVKGLEPINNAEKSLGQLGNGYQSIKAGMGLGYKMEGRRGAGTRRESSVLPLGLWAERLAVPRLGPGVLHGRPSSWLGQKEAVPTRQYLPKQGRRKA